jgi:hypothetical protein
MVLKILFRAISSPRHIKLFISSREGLIDDISKVFGISQRLTMHCKEAEADIPTYVEYIIQEKIKSRELLVGNNQLVQQVQDALIQGANGM